MKAVIYVDIQNDFVEGGSLAVTGGVALAEKLAKDTRNGYTDNFDVTVVSQDWHIDPGNHFADVPDYVDTWPAHCVAETEGANIVKVLAEALEGKVDVVIHKGMYEAAYSAFEGVDVATGKNLADVLREKGVTDVTVIGIASDYCVRKTALDSANEGFNTTVDTRYIVGINPEKVRETLLQEFPKAGVKVNFYAK